MIVGVNNATIPINPFGFRQAALERPDYLKYFNGQGNLFK